MRTSRIVSGVLMAIAGFACWAAISLVPQEQGLRIVEAWDREIYWSVGIPALLIAQAIVGALVQTKLWREPACVVAGHFLAVLLVRRTGSDFGLLPLSIGFIGLPMFGALCLVAALGRTTRNAFFT